MPVCKVILARTCPRRLCETSLSATASQLREDPSRRGPPRDGRAYQHCSESGKLEDFSSSFPHTFQRERLNAASGATVSRMRQRRRPSRPPRSPIQCLRKTAHLAHSPESKGQTRRLQGRFFSTESASMQLTGMEYTPFRAAAQRVSVTLVWPAWPAEESFPFPQQATGQDCWAGELPAKNISFIYSLPEPAFHVVFIEDGFKFPS